MILTGNEILKQVKNKRIWIDPFDVSLATTNSYDLHLGKNIIKYTSKIIDPRIVPEYKTVTIPDSGYRLNPGDFVLSSTLEKVGSPKFVPIIHAKSGIARMGLFVHVTADLIDIGSYGNLTLQLYSTLPLIIYPNMLIAQVSFWVPKGKIILYNGKYQGSDGPKISQIARDFK